MFRFWIWSFNRFPAKSQAKWCACVNNSSSLPIWLIFWNLFWSKRVTFLNRIKMGCPDSLASVLYWFSLPFCNIPCKKVRKTARNSALLHHMQHCAATFPQECNAMLQMMQFGFIIWSIPYTNAAQCYKWCSLIALFAAFASWLGHFFQFLKKNVSILNLMVQ